MDYKCANCRQDFYVASHVETAQCPVCGSHDIQMRVRYASFWRRAGAFLLDFFFWLLAMVLATGLLSLILSSVGNSVSEPLTAVAPIGIMTLSTTLVFIVPSLIWRGQTPGKRITGIAVVSKSGDPVTWWQVILRVPLYLLASYLPFTLGFFWCIWDKEKRCFHDMIIQTRVIYAADRESIAQAMQRQQIVLDAVLAGQAPKSPLEMTEATITSADVTLHFPAKWVGASPKDAAPRFIPYRRGTLELGREHLKFQGWVNRHAGWFILPLLALFPLSYICGNAASYDEYGYQQTPVCCPTLVFFMLGGVLLWLIWDFGIAKSERVMFRHSSIQNIQTDAVKKTITITTVDKSPLGQYRVTVKPDRIEQVARVIKQRIDAKKNEAGDDG